MEDAAAVRRAAREAVGDVEPERLRTEILARVDEGSAAPGVLALQSARCAADAGAAVADAHRDVAAGVQLVYEGLRLTRRLVQEEPWRTGGDGADVDMLVADVLVARGFVLLSRTEATDVAVSLVRGFGRDQTRRRTAPDPEALDANLEVDVLRLAIVAGQTAPGGPAPGDVGPLARDLVETHGGLPPAEALCTAATRDRLDGLVAADGGGVGARRD